MRVKVIASKTWDVFLRHGVVVCDVEHRLPKVLKSGDQTTGVSTVKVVWERRGPRR